MTFELLLGAWVATGLTLFIFTFLYQDNPLFKLAEHLYVVDPMGRWMMRVPGEPDPARLKRDIERLLRASASWDRPGR